MKKIIILLLLTLLGPAAWAQKEVRKNVREGNEAYKDQRYGAAEEKYEEALKINPSAKEASFNLANTYYRQQRWDDALKEYERYLMIEKEDPIKVSSAWSGVGNTFLKKKASEKYLPKPKKGEEKDYLKLSMEAYKQALRFNPKDDETRHNLAVVQKMILDQQNDESGGGKDQQQNQNKQDKDNQDKQDQQENKDQKEHKKDQNQDEDDSNQMSQQNMEQILESLQQEERNTQERVNQAKIREQERRNAANRNQNKDW